MPIIWIARLLGIPIKRRIAGSDIFEALKTRPDAERPLKIFVFGGTEHVVSTLSQRLNCGDELKMCRLGLSGLRQCGRIERGSFHRSNKLE